jgi:hypothetical protein
MSESTAPPPRWSEPDLRRDVDSDSEGLPAWKIQLVRGDGERAHIRLVDDGSGGLTVTVDGSEGADIDLMEDRQAPAPIMLHPHYLSPVGIDWDDRKRVWEAFAANGDDWQASNPGPNLYVHAHADGTEIVTGYAEFTGRLVYAEVRRQGDADAHRLTGTAKLDSVLATIRSK